jgi:hypothetical protein
MHSLDRHTILQIELVRDESALEQIFSPRDKPITPEQVSANLHDAMAANDLDTFLFIPSYTGLFIVLSIVVGRFSQLRTAGRLSIFISVLAVATAFCDWSENRGIAVAIRHIQAHGVPETGDAHRISNPSLAKWSFTILVLALSGVAALATKRWWGVGLGVSLIILCLLTATGLYEYVAERWLFTEKIPVLHSVGRSLSCDPS